MIAPEDSRQVVLHEVHGMENYHKILENYRRASWRQRRAIWIMYRNMRKDFDRVPRSDDENLLPLGRLILR